MSLFHLALSIISRRQPVFWDRYREDALQEAHLAALTITAPTNTDEDIRAAGRAIERHAYAAARAYGCERRGSLETGFAHRRAGNRANYLRRKARKEPA